MRLRARARGMSPTPGSGRWMAATGSSSRTDVIEEVPVSDTPAFEQLAQRILDRYAAVAIGGSEVRSFVSQSLGTAVVEALRETWNARGTADVAAIDAALSLEMGADSSRELITQLAHAVRVLDR